MAHALLRGPLMLTPPPPDAPPSEPPAELVQRYDHPAPRYTSYPTAPGWTDAFGPEDFRDALLRAGERADEPLSLYVHIPFCPRLCTYCGCNVVVERRTSAAEGYLELLEREMDLVASFLGRRRRVTQLHWGGGTPTFLSSPQLRRLSGAIGARFEVDAGAEVAIEVNPATLVDGQLETLRELGFNRLSVGVQDLDVTVQRAINRYQTEAQTRGAVERARALGFSGVNVDLVYGLPHQTEASWARTLDTLRELRPDRVAVFAFAYLPEQIPHQRRLPVSAMLQGPAKLGLLRAAERMLRAEGYLAIGLDHFALPGDSLSLAAERGQLHRNFQGYTVRAAGELVGLGASAISDVGSVYAQNARDLETYGQAVAAGRLATCRGWRLDAEDVERRRIIMSLMTALRADLGPSGEQHFAAELERLRPLERDGLVSLGRGAVQVTPPGRPFLRTVAMAFDARSPSAATFSRAV